MPALDVLNALPNNWKTEFNKAILKAQMVAKKLPLVRVVIPRTDPKRRREEISDVLIHGDLRRTHKSDRSRDIERRLHVPESLYFHAGRPHEDYGDAIFIIEDTANGVEVEATPFGLGQLLCGKKTDMHKQGRCLAPISHEDDCKQRLFVRGSIWKADWRDRAAQYLALYFGSDPSRYFMEGDKGKPQKHDPDCIYSNDDNKDWRSWRIEVRVLGDISLFDVLARKQLLFWAMKKRWLAKLRSNIGARPQKHFVIRVYPKNCAWNRPIRARESMMIQPRK